MAYLTLYMALLYQDLVLGTLYLASLEPCIWVPPCLLHQFNPIFEYPVPFRHINQSDT